MKAVGIRIRPLAPKVDARFAKGAISYSKVRAITRIATEKNEEYLLMIARHGTAYHVETLVRKYRRAKRLQDADHARAQHDSRNLSYFFDEDDCLVLKGRFPPEQGALIVKALEMAMDRDFAAQDDVSAETPVAEEPIGARRADALAAVAEAHLNAKPVPNSTADRYQVVVHVVGARLPLRGINQRRPTEPAATSASSAPWRCSSSTRP